MQTVRVDEQRMIDSADMREAPSQDVRATHLLLVEDDIDIRELVAGSLRSQGYDVEEAADGQDALAAIARERPSLLITDCCMPNMSGNELVELLARDEQLSSIPALVISAVSEPALPANVRLFLRKPFTFAQLRAAVRECLG